MKHKHHIIPRHMGGTDDPSNLVEVSVEEHAELHFALYLEHGKVEDWFAYRGLSGLITKSELCLELCRTSAYKQWERDLIWITNGIDEKRVERHLLPDGYWEGRSSLTNCGGPRSFYSEEEREQKRIKRTQMNIENNPMKSRIWITDGKSNKTILKSDTIPLGWRRGRVVSDETKKKMSESAYKRHSK